MTVLNKLHTFGNVLNGFPHKIVISKQKKIAFPFKFERNCRHHLMLGLCLNKLSMKVKFKKK